MPNSRWKIQNKLSGSIGGSLSHEVLTVFFSLQVLCIYMPSGFMFLKGFLGVGSCVSLYLHVYHVDFFCGGKGLFLFCLFVCFILFEIFLFSALSYFIFI